MKRPDSILTTRHSILAVAAGLLLALAGLESVSSAEVIDRIVATVNGTAILQSDWEDAIRFEAFSDGKPLAALTDADRKATLERLIDQALIAQQIRAAAFAVVTDADVTAQVAAMRKQHPAGATDEAWKAALAGYGLDESDVTAAVRRELNALRFIEQRFRPGVQVTQAEIEKYYRDEFLPQLRRAGGQDKPLAEVKPRIEELLKEDRVNTLLAAWLQSLRSQARIAIRSTPPAAAARGDRAASPEAARVP